MRVPIRKSGKYTNLKPDTQLTQEKFLELKKQLERLKKIDLPKTAQETKRLAEMGDLSENAAYSIAKGKLRFINQKIIEIENQLGNATIIKPKNKSVVEIGHKVTVEFTGGMKTYLILGSSEINLKQNTISYLSPLGKMLLGKKVGDIIQLKTPKQIVQYKIINIE